MLLTAVSLVALSLGYRSFVDAAKEKEGTKILGQAIAVFVMVLALVGSLLGLCPKYGKHGWGHPWKGGHGFQHHEKARSAAEARSGS